MKCRKNKMSWLEQQLKEIGAIPVIWNKLPKRIIEKGKARGWRKIKKLCSNFLTDKQPKPKTKSTKRTIAKTYQILPSTGLNQELNDGQHMTIADCLVDYSKIKKVKSKYFNKC
jgi:hypothetical protein